MRWAELSHPSSNVDAGVVLLPDTAGFSPAPLAISLGDWGEPQGIPGWECTGRSSALHRFCTVQAGCKQAPAPQGSAACLLGFLPFSSSIIFSPSLALIFTRYPRKMHPWVQPVRAGHFSSTQRRSPDTWSDARIFLSSCWSCWCCSCWRISICLPPRLAPAQHEHKEGFVKGMHKATGQSCSARGPEARPQSGSLGGEAKRRPFSLLFLSFQAESGAS